MHARKRDYAACRPALPPSIYPPIGHLELGTAAANVLLFLQRLVN